MHGQQYYVCLSLNDWTIDLDIADAGMFIHNVVGCSQVVNSIKFTRVKSQGNPPTVHFPFETYHQF